MFDLVVLLFSTKPVACKVEIVHSLYILFRPCTSQREILTFFNTPVKLRTIGLGAWTINTGGDPTIDLG